MTQTTLPGEARPYVLEAGTGRADLLLGQVFRTLVSGAESRGALGFVSMAGPKGAPIPMHRHAHAHDVFYCERGAIQVWFDGASRVLYPGDVASVPPGTLHAYAIVRPSSRSIGPITPGGWERFFAFVGEPYAGPAFPPEDHSPPPFAKFAQAEQEFDTTYVRDAPYPDATDGPDDRVPGAAEPYVLKAGEGERYLLHGIVSRPLITGAESGGAFGFEHVEGPRGAVLPAQTHDSHTILYVLDGRLDVTVDGVAYSAAPGDCVSIPAGAEHGYALAGAETRLLATYAPAGPERRFLEQGEPWPHEIFPRSATMSGMLMRSLLLALAALALSGPAANAAVADRFVPVYGASDGVQVGTGKRNVYLRFGPKAATLYRTFAGHTVQVGCGRHGDDSRTGGRVSFDPNTGRTTLTGGGYASTEQRLPRTRSRVDLPFAGDPYDVCYIATTERRRDSVCMPVSAFGHDAQCVRMIVALNDAGRADIDARSRLIELDFVGDAAMEKIPVKYGATQLARLQHVFGADVTALDGPDAAPPPGKVGFWQQGQTTVVAVVLSDGHRQFVSQDGEVYSTNVPAFSGGDDDVFTLP